MIRGWNKLSSGGSSNGKSAYELWVSAGNTGTLQNFLSSLVGATGATGSSGSGTTANDCPRMIVHGDVKFNVNAGLNVSWSSGTLYTMTGGKYVITAGNKSFSSTDWNPGQPVLSFLTYNPVTALMEAVQAPNIGTYADRFFIFGVTNAGETVVYPLLYNPDLIGSSIVAKMLSEPIIKELTLIGDSITANNRWAAYLDLNIPKITNLAVSGMRMAGANGMCATKRTLVSSSSDLCIIMGGTNDAANIPSLRMTPIPIGAIGDGNQNNYLGAYSMLLDYLLTQNPKIRIILMTPPQLFYTMDAGDIRNNSMIEPYRQGTRDIASYYGFPCIDLARVMGWNAVTNSAFSGDGLHPNEAASRVMARIIDRFIRQNF